MAAKNQGKKIYCTLIVHEIDEHSGRSKKMARADVELPCGTVSRAIEMAATQVVTKLKRG